MLDFSHVAQKLGTTWAEKMYAAFARHTTRVPRLWPGTKPQAKRLAAAYFSGNEDCDRLANEVQRVAAGTWARLSGGGARSLISSRPVRAVLPSGGLRTSRPSLPSYH